MDHVQFQKLISKFRNFRVGVLSRLAMDCFVLRTSATEADVVRQSWLRKVHELKITPGISGSEAFFRSNLSIFVLRTKVSMWKRCNAVENAQVLKLEEDEWQALRAVEIEPPPSETGPIARRSPMQAVMELLPALTRGERHCVLFKLAAMNGPAVESRELAILETKQAMQQILRERPLAEWGEALAPFVQSALLDAGDRPVAFKYPDACMSGLMLLIAHPPHDWGYSKTRRPELDAPIRVVDIRKSNYYTLGFHEPWTYPATPSPHAGQAFECWVQFQDLNGDWSPTMHVPWDRFCESPTWKASVNVDFSLWASTQERWRYPGGAGTGSIYAFAERHRPSPKRARSFDIERYYNSDAYDQHLALQKEAEERARKGYRFALETVDPEVLALLNERKRHRS